MNTKNPTVWSGCRPCGGGQKSGLNWVLFLGLSVVLWVLSGGCRTAESLETFDTNQAGWVFRQGQAVWKQDATAPGLVLGFNIATHRDGRTQVQMLKEIILLATVQIGPAHWVLEDPLRRRRTVGAMVNGEVRETPGRARWLQVALGLSDRPVHPPWILERPDAGEVVIRNPETGERIELFFDL